MTFQEAEKLYNELAVQHTAGKLNDADFESKVNELRIQDAQGRWWQIGVQSGDWYVNDGQKWTKSTPPTDALAVGETPVAALDSAATEPVRPSMPPRQIFSSKPIGRGNGGLPRPAFIAIIVVVALLGAGLIFGGYMLLSGQLKLGGAPTVRATATQVAVVLPTQPVIVAPTQPVLPTQPLPTLPPSSPAVTATTPITVTNTRPPAATRTPTRAVTAGPTLSSTPSAPPGLYVTNIVPDPTSPIFSSPTGFTVSFFNTSGGTRRIDWVVKVFQVDNQNRSIGETKRLSTEVATGASTVLMDRTWASGPGVCEFVAEVYYLDREISGQLLPIARPNGGRGVFGFKMAC